MLSLKYFRLLLLLLLFLISHTQTITIHYIYNSLQVTVIVYKKRNKKKKKDKVHKNTIVYILTIKRRLPALGSSINIPTIIIPTLKDNLNFNLTKLAKHLQE